MVNEEGRFGAAEEWRESRDGSRVFNREKVESFLIPLPLVLSGHLQYHLLPGL